MPGETRVLGRVLVLDKLWNLNGMCVAGEGWVSGEGDPTRCIKDSGAKLMHPREGRVHEEPE